MVGLGLLQGRFRVATGCYGLGLRSREGRLKASNLFQLLAFGTRFLHLRMKPFMVAGFSRQIVGCGDTCHVEEDVETMP